MARVPFSVALGCWLAFLVVCDEAYELVGGRCGICFHHPVVSFRGLPSFLCMLLEFFVVHPLDCGFAAWQRLLE
jgi:hypothetical protein